MRIRLLRIAAGTAMLSLASVANAQNTLEAPVGDIVRFVYDSGPLPNARNEVVLMDQQVIQMPGSAWLRLYFDEAALDVGSFLRITSMKDGEVQILDNPSLGMWSNTTAYFNGDMVVIELFAGPNTKKNFFKIGQLGREMNFARPEGDPGQCGICGGSDDRVPSAQNFSGRIMPVGCTGSVYCTGDGMITAGHCVSGGSATVMHFNVPASLANCATVAPPVNDQFPILPGFQFEHAGIGNDWAAYRVGTNGLGQTPFARYGQMRALAAGPAANGTATNIFGYGLDTNCVRSQTQQQSAGAITQVDAQAYRFSNDIRGGNSGSGFLNAAGQIIGVVTHCSFAGCPGYATRHDDAQFAAAITAVGCGAPPAPANNNCSSAFFLGLGSTAGTTVSATNDGNATCGASTTSPDVWYYFIPTCGGTYRFSTCDAGTNYDTVLSAHTGCPGTTSNQIACNDDIGSGVCALSGLRSQIDVVMTPGTVYYIRVSGFNGAAGNFTLVSSAVSLNAPPANNACAAAIAIGLGTVNTSTYCATDDGDSLCAGSTSPDIWYSFNPPCTGTYVFDTCAVGRNYDTVLSLHTGCPGTGANQVTCNDDVCGLGSSISANLTSGTTYRLRVAGFGTSVGNAVLTVSQVAPSNDNCSNAIDVSAGGAFNGNLCGATNDGSALCGASASNPDVWYRWTNPSCYFRTLSVNTCGSFALSGVDTVVSIHTTCPGTNASQLICNDDSTCGTTPTLDSTASAQVAGGQTVYIRVSKFGTRILAPFILNVSSSTALSNDLCANQATVGNGSWAYGNQGANTDGTAAGICVDVANNQQVNQDVWFRYVATCTGTVTVNTCNTVGYDSKLAVYNNQGCPPSNPIGCNDDMGSACPSSGLRSQVVFPATNGAAYIIRVGGYQAATGCGVLNISCRPAGCWGNCVADFDDGSGTGTPDGGVTIEDLLHYLNIFDQGLICADVDDGTFTNTLDGGVTIEDLLYYLFRFDLGC